MYVFFLLFQQKLTSHMATHALDYKRNYTSKKPRKPRKDKGVSRTDYARLLSGFYEDLEEDAGTSATESAEVINHESATDGQGEETAEESKGIEEMECD